VRRREFLALGSLGPALLALSSLPLAGFAAADAAPDASARVLDHHERELFLAITERMVETGLPHAPRARDTGALATAERALAALDPALVSALRIALALVDWWPALVELRFTRFTALSPEAQDESLEGWRASRSELRRRVFYALRNLAFLGYWSQDATWGLVGYPGPWLGRRA
jgi:hypothetical protein